MHACVCLRVAAACVCTCTTCLCQIPALSLSANTQNKEERRTHCLCAHVWAAADKSALNTHTHTHTSLCGAYNVCASVCACVYTALSGVAFLMCVLPASRCECVRACVRADGGDSVCSTVTHLARRSALAPVTPATRNAISSQRF